MGHHLVNTGDITQNHLRNPLGTDTMVFRRFDFLARSGPAGGEGDAQRAEEVANEIYVPDPEYRRLRGITAASYQQILDGGTQQGVALRALQEIDQPQSFLPLSKAKKT